MVRARIMTAAAIIVVLVPVLILGKLEGTVLLVAAFCAVAICELSGNLSAAENASGAEFDACRRICDHRRLLFPTGPRCLGRRGSLSACGLVASSFPLQRHREYP